MNASALTREVCRSLVRPHRRDQTETFSTSFYNEVALALVLRAHNVDIYTLHSASNLHQSRPRFVCCSQRSSQRTYRVGLFTRDMYPGVITATKNFSPIASVQPLPQALLSIYRV